MISYSLDKYEQYREMAKFLNHWLWDCFGTLTFPASEKFDPEFIKKCFKRWLREICLRERIQVACYFIVAHNGVTAHIHFLLFSRCAARTEEIDRTWFVHEKEWEKYWPYRSSIDCVRSQLKARTYFARHLWKHRHDFVEMDFYNTKLLTKEKLDDCSVRLLEDILNV